MHKDIVPQNNMGSFVLFEEVISIQDNFKDSDSIPWQLLDDSYSSQGQQNF